MATSIDTTGMIAFVREYVRTHGRACPSDALRYVGNFAAKDIKAAKDAGVFTAVLGKEGGLYVKGEELAPKGETKGASLKARLAALVEQVANGETVNAGLAKALVEEYQAECAKRTRQ